MNERELLEMLETIDRPRHPRPEFARRLQAELFDAGNGAVVTAADERERSDRPDTVEAVEPVDMEVARPPARHRVATRRIARVAIAASIVLAFGSVAILARHEPARRPAAVSKQSIEAACQSFNANAFSGLTRTQLLGDFNTSALTNTSTARARTETLLGALRAFSADLEQAGVKDSAPLATIATSEGFATRALNLIDQNSLAAAADSLKEIGTRLDEVQRDLITIGVAQCL